jgi:hypothetical protein
MKDRKKRQNGFVLVIVMVILTLIGTYMIVLTNNANTLLFQADRAYLEACDQNLAASGLAWARKNIGSTKTSTGAFELDAAAMNIRGAVIRIDVSPGEKGTSQVQISTSCSRARQSLNFTRKFTVEAR